MSEKKKTQVLKAVGTLTGKKAEKPEEVKETEKEEVEKADSESNNA